MRANSFVGRIVIALRRDHGPTEAVVKPEASFVGRLVQALSRLPSDWRLEESRALDTRGRAAADRARLLARVMDEHASAAAELHEANLQMWRSLQAEQELIRLGLRAHLIQEIERTVNEDANRHGVSQGPASDSPPPSSQQA